MYFRLPTLSSTILNSICPFCTLQILTERLQIVIWYLQSLLKPLWWEVFSSTFYNQNCILTLYRILGILHLQNRKERRQKHDNQIVKPLRNERFCKRICSCLPGYFMLGSLLLFYCMCPWHVHKITFTDPMASSETMGFLMLCVNYIRSRFYECTWFSIGSIKGGKY